MHTTIEQRERNWPLWAGVLLIILFLISFVLFFVGVPGQQVLPWANLFLSAVALVLLMVGLRRARKQPGRYGSKAVSWVFTVLSTLLLFFAIFAFYVARHLPDADGAPKIGQKAPDFELKDTNGQTISLAQLLQEPLHSGNEAKPKAVLLVFYRGYW